MSDVNTDQTPEESDAIHAVLRLTKEVEQLNKHRFITLHNSPLRLLTFQFARGLAFGLGSVLGATILVSLLAWWLAQFEFIPVLGAWAAQIVDQIQQAQ